MIAITMLMSVGSVAAFADADDKTDGYEASGNANGENSADEMIAAEIIDDLLNDEEFRDSNNFILSVGFISRR